MGTTSRTCRWVCRRLPLHVGGELVGLDRRRVDRHLITCPACRSQQASIAQSLSVLQEVAEVLPHRTAAHRLAETSSVWPALARQIREAKHEANRSRSWRAGARRLASYGLAASLILALTWVWTTEPGQSRLPVRVESGDALSARGTAPIAPVVAPVEPEPAGAELDSTPALIALDKLAVLPHSGGVRESALPSGEELRPAAPARPGFDPFQPPLTLRFDYDLDRGSSSQPATRDAQRAY